MTARDPELTRLLAQELRRHLGELSAQSSTEIPLERARRTVHALKGSAGLAGEPELAGAMQRLERRLATGEHAALDEVTTTIEDALARLSAGESAIADSWPKPPADLRVRPIDPLVRTQYVAEISDRLAQIDAAIGDGGSKREAALSIYRHVHTMKGAASAANDEAMAWFCHGLEERIRRGHTGSEEAVHAIEEVASHRAVLGSLLTDPEAALAMLRGSATGSQATAGNPVYVASSWPEEERRDSFRDELRASGGDKTVRIGASSIDQLIDHVSGISLARERLSVRLSQAPTHGSVLRRLRGDLAEALRLIGPPRPWGAPAAALRRIERVAQMLLELGEMTEGAMIDLDESGQALKEHLHGARKILADMRRMPIRGMFARVEAAVLAEARRTGRVVVVRTVGADESIDRRLAERLVEPCLQLARNAIAHGIELPSVRQAKGKSPEAMLTFRARRLGSRLVVSIEDDGAGVDVAKVRARALESGIVTEALAEAADDQTLLELLFLPGFSTRAQSPDLLAGRGVGLDITLAAVQRLGGAIRLSSRPDGGFQARLDIPIESGLVEIVWVKAAGVEYAIPAQHARRVRVNEDLDADRIPHLAACLDFEAKHPEPSSTNRAAFALDLDVDLDARERFAIGVDSVGATEGVLVRELSPLIRDMGPFAGAIVRGDGSLSLALDVYALAPRVRAIGRLPEGRVSERPPASRRSHE